MRVADVRKKYPEFFATVEASVWDDSLGSIDNLPYAVCNKVRKRLAYNAAAVATLELHKIASRKKNIVAGKTSNNNARREIAALIRAFNRYPKDRVFTRGSVVKLLRQLSAVA